MSDARIPVNRLRPVREMLLGKRRLVGTGIAKKMRQNHNTFWSWMYRRGLPADQATKLATVIEDYARKLLALAGDLRADAAAARETARNRV